MIAEIGHYSLILALAVSLVQGTIPLVGAHRNVPAWIAVAGPAALVQLVLAIVAFGALTWAYVVSDFSVANVAANSHSLKPMLYKVSGVWGNHEGSLLLWVLILAIFGAAVTLFGRNLPAPFRARVLAVQALVAIGFLLFMLLTSNPFARLDPAPLDGQGLNPLLQDPGLAFHPPFLYLGYVGFSMAFAFAIAALIEGRVDPAWARWVRPWTLAAWILLTLGIVGGSHWAYYELGWGGWWFWDPVENASFMPWLAGTALLHSAIVVEKRDTLKSWTILLAILTFSLSLLGTFLVRSGVLTSVHAFATDPARGVFILGFLLVVVGGSLVLYAVRAPALKAGGLFAPMSREGSLVLNNLLLSTATATVLLGTLYPLILDSLTGKKVSVGKPYFDLTFGPLMVPLLAAMAIGPLMAWKRGDLAGAMHRLRFAFWVALVAMAAIWWQVSKVSVLALFGYGFAAWVAVGVLIELAERVWLFRAGPAETWRRARRLPRSAVGMTLAHLGIAISLVGIVSSEAFTEEHLIVVRPGDVTRVGPFDVKFEGVSDVQGPNYSALRGRFAVSRGGEALYVLEPESRTYPVPPMTTTEASIRPTLGGDLYVVVGEPQDGGNAARLYFKPLVQWIWIGGLVMAIGGMLSLSDRRHRVGAPRAARLPAGASPSPAE